METFFIACLGIAVVTLVIQFRLRRSRDILEDWVDSRGYRLVSARYCWLLRGPFTWRSSQAQCVYRVTVEDRQGRKRDGWVQCGSFMLGVIQKSARAIWDD